MAEGRSWFPVAGAGGAAGVPACWGTPPRLLGGHRRGLTCSNSSVMVLGSSCLWNHIMYLVWKRHDCFFRALAARYCAFVPWGRWPGSGLTALSPRVGRTVPPERAGAQQERTQRRCLTAAGV